MPEITTPYALVIIAILVLAGAAASKISTRLNVPVLLVFLGVGIVAGEDVSGWIVFDNAHMANALGTLAMAFILFSGGFDTSWKDVKKVIGYGSVLSSVGVFLTALFVGLFAYFAIFHNNENIFSETPDAMVLAWCLLLGSIISSTDAAAVFAILRSRSVSLKGNLKPMLEYESGSNDPMAAFLTLFMVGMIAEPGSASYLDIPLAFVVKMGLGIGWGIVWGKLAVWLYNHIDLEYDGLYYVLGIGFVMITFGSSELLYGNGFMSVYVAGLVMGNSKFVFQNGLGRFLDGMAWLMQVMLFVMLGLFVNPSKLPAALPWAIAIALFLMFVARPVAVFLCMLGSRYSKKERLFISWVGLRGGAPIMLVTFPMLFNTPRNDLLFEIVFVIVALSVLIQGKTLMPLARRLKLDKPLREQPRSPLNFENTGDEHNQTAEFEVPAGSPFAGKRLVELKLPESALVLLIRRGNNFVVPRGATQVQERDALMLIASEKDLDEIAKRILPEHAAQEEV